MNRNSQFYPRCLVSVSHVSVFFDEIKECYHRMVVVTYLDVEVGYLPIM